MEHVEHDLSRYAAMVQALARHAIGLAIDASPHQPKPGEVRYSLIHLLPAARQLIGEASGTQISPESPPTDSPATFTDGLGQSRPIYRSFAAYLHARATSQHPPLKTEPREDVSRQLWQAWHQLARGDHAAVAVVDRVTQAHPDSLHPQSLDEPPDHWTYRELVGLHALRALIELADTRDDLPAQPAWRQRLIEITNYHQYHTQPDYTTYQPWGLAAFLSNPETIMFAEQQLHDTQSHLQIEGGAGALLPALLLADAFASISS